MGDVGAGGARRRNASDADVTSGRRAVFGALQRRLVIPRGTSMRPATLLVFTTLVASTWHTAGRADHSRPTARRWHPEVPTERFGFARLGSRRAEQFPLVAPGSSHEERCGRDCRASHTQHPHQHPPSYLSSFHHHLYLHPYTNPNIQFYIILTTQTLPN